MHARIEQLHAGMLAILPVLFELLAGSNMIWRWCHTVSLKIVNKNFEFQSGVDKNCFGLEVDERLRRKRLHELHGVFWDVRGDRSLFRLGARMYDKREKLFLTA